MGLVEYTSTWRARDIRILREGDEIVEASADTSYGKKLLEEIISDENKMFYTLGNPESYESYLLTPCPKKLGRKDDYPGGSIFRTKKLASKYLKDNNIPFKIYGVIVQERDVDFSKENENGFGDLLIDSLLIKIA